MEAKSLARLRKNWKTSLEVEDFGQLNSALQRTKVTRRAWKLELQWWHELAGAEDAVVLGASAMHRDMSIYIYFFQAGCPESLSFT